MSEFCNVLRRLRESKKILQKDIAKELDISPAAYSLYEKGQREPKLDLLEKMAKYFGVTIDYLLTGNAPSIEPDKTDTKVRNRIMLPNSIVLDITRENYEKYPKYFDVGFSEIRKMLFKMPLIDADTGKKLEKEDFEKLYDSFSLDDKLEFCRSFVDKFAINIKFDIIDIYMHTTPEE